MQILSRLSSTLSSSAKLDVHLGPLALLAAVKRFDNSPKFQTALVKLYEVDRYVKLVAFGFAHIIWRSGGDILMEGSAKTIFN